MEILLKDTGLVFRFFMVYCHGIMICTNSDHVSLPCGEHAQKGNCQINSDCFLVFDCWGLGLRFQF